MMTSLDSAAHEIGKVIGIISDIAEQTKLLALNASIEAASAGDAGKGFAVVATEVKELARQTANATQKIHSEVENMQKSVDGSVKAIESIASVIERVNSISQTIAGAVEPQSATIGQISSNISSVNIATSGIAGKVRLSSQGLKTIDEDIHGVDNGIREAADAVAGIKNESEGLKMQASQLQDMVRKFKV
jgi:methyl-accepting chemotaxis protein